MASTLPGYKIIPESEAQQSERNIRMLLVSAAMMILIGIALVCVGFLIAQAESQRSFITLLTVGFAMIAAGLTLGTTFLVTTNAKQLGLWLDPNV